MFSKEKPFNEVCFYLTLRCSQSTVKAFVLFKLLWRPAAESLDLSREVLRHLSGMSIEVSTPSEIAIDFKM